MFFCYSSTSSLCNNCTHIIKHYLYRYQQSSGNVVLHVHFFLQSKDILHFVLIAGKPINEPIVQHGRLYYILVLVCIFACGTCPDLL